MSAAAPTRSSAPSEVCLALQVSAEDGCDVSVLLLPLRREEVRRLIGQCTLAAETKERIPHLAGLSLFDFTRALYVGDGMNSDACIPTDLAGGIGEACDALQEAVGELDTQSALLPARVLLALPRVEGRSMDLERIEATPENLEFVAWRGELRVASALLWKTELEAVLRLFDGAAPMPNDVTDLGTL